MSNSHLQNAIQLIMKTVSAVILSLLLGSCVGVIEELNPPVTKGASVDLPRINFSGIHDVVPIANDKAEVFFFPADGDVRDLTYIVSYDGAPTPISIPAESLRPDYRGLLKVTVRGLEVNTIYNFTVQVKHSNGQTSDTPKSLNARTFANTTANFFGIGNVRNTAGTDGLTSFSVSWPEAERRGTVFVPNEIDVVEYVITAVDSEFLTPGDLNNKSFDRPFRYEFIVPGTQSSRVINSLRPGREYHVQVRAVHSGFKDFGSIPGYKAEENSDYITISTLSTDSSGVEFDPSNITAVRFNGSLGLTSIEVEWDNAVGAFDHYRIYYNPTSQTFTSSSAIGVNCLATTAIPCKKVRFDRNYTIVTDLVPLSEYEVNVVICVDIDCSNFFLFERKTTVTDPGIAIYGGVTNILNPRIPSRLDEIYLRTNPPDITSGNIDGLLVEVKARAASSGPSTDTILNHPTEPNTSNLTVSEFEFETVTEVAVRGITLNSPEPYCFSIFPYVYIDDELEEQRTNEVVRCHSPQLETPDSDQFSGLDDMLVDIDFGTVDLFWSSPSSGLAAQVKVFIRIGSGQFNFSEAISGNPNYITYTLPISETQLTIPFLPSGTYSFGALTYIDALDSSTDPGAGYSEFNQSIMQVDL